MVQQLDSTVLDASVQGTKLRQGFKYFIYVFVLLLFLGPVSHALDTSIWASIRILVFGYFEKRVCVIFEYWTTNTGIRILSIRPIQIFEYPNSPLEVSLDTHLFKYSLKAFFLLPFQGSLRAYPFSCCQRCRVRAHLLSEPMEYWVLSFGEAFPVI